MRQQLVWLAVILAICSGAAFSQSDTVCRLEKIVTATGVELKDPVGEAKEFDASIGKVYCWMRIACGDIPKTVTHVWYLENEEQLKVPLTVKFPSMRTWSHKNIRPGNWKVQVKDDTGAVLGEISFVIR